MITETYEKAIDALKGDVVIDEMVIVKGGQVKCAYGHTKYCYIMWDDMGRGFSCYVDEDLPLHPMNPRLEVEYEGEWVRDYVFDLKFK